MRGAEVVLGRITGSDNSGISSRSAPAAAARAAASMIFLLLPSTSPTVQLSCATATLTLELMMNKPADGADYCTRVIGDLGNDRRRGMERAGRKIRTRQSVPALRVLACTTRDGLRASRGMGNAVPDTMARPTSWLARYRCIASTIPTASMSLIERGPVRISSTASITTRNGLQRCRLLRCRHAPDCGRCTHTERTGR